MKDYCRFGLLFGILFVWLALDLAAQAPMNGYCGTRMGRSDWLKNYQRNPGAVARTTDTLYLPVHIHRVSDSNGEGAVTFTYLIDQMCLLNEQFASSMMQFYIAGITDLADNQVHNHSSTTSVSNKLRTNKVANRINIFFVENAGGACGYWIFPTDVLVVTIDGAGCQLGGADLTLPHEIGHYFRLPHTFYGWEDVVELDFEKPAPETVFYRNENVPVERADGSNCAIAGDGFCDTSPDYLNYRWPCEGDTISPEVQLDPDSVAFQSFAGYIMGYSYDGCQNTFSAEQQQAMRANATEQRQDLPTTASPELLAPPNPDQLLQLEPLNGTNTTYFDSISFAWSPVENAFGYRVQFNIVNNFANGVVAFEFFASDTTLVVTEGLSMNRRYYWRVIPVMPYANCAEYAYPVKNFRTSSVSPVIDPVLSGALKIYPNPVANGMLVLELNDGSLRGDLDYEFIDRLGRVVRRGTIGNFDTTRIDVSGLPQGIYFLRARADGRFTTKKVVVN